MPLLTIAAVGDLQLGDSSICVGFGLRSRYHDAPAAERLLAGIRSYLDGMDVVFGNLECTLSLGTDPLHTWRTAQMRGIPDYVRALRRVGFNVLNVANNHAMQHGVGAFTDTVALLREHGIAPCGLRGTPPWEAEPVVLTAGDERLGLLAYCLRSRQYHSDLVPPFAEGRPESIRADVRRLRPEVDAVAVSLHWGEEFVPQPSTDEVALAASILDAGASLILGHHPHVVRPVVRYDEGLIAYSLGNCAADMIWYEPLRHGLLLRATLRADRVEEAMVLPLRIDDEFRPQPASAWRIADDRPMPLEAGPYARAIESTWADQRRCAYAYVLRNVWRFRPLVLAELVRTTLRNKLGLAS